MRVRDARDAYLAENGFTVAGYTEKWTEASFLGVKFVVPNTVPHQRGIMLHDLHHVATGFGTDIAGEAVISAWEVRGGLRGTGLYVTAIVLSAGSLGIVAAPRRIIRGLRDEWGSPTSLFATTTPYESLLDLTVGELRTLVGVPQEGSTTIPRELHAFAPKHVGAAAA